MKSYWQFISIGIFSTLIACSNPTTPTEKTIFTKADSVTETYLVLQDSLLRSWNILVNEENEKMNNLNTLVTQLMKSGNEERVLLNALDDRLAQLKKIRITQKTLGNPYVVEEYDFASNSLVAEIISVAENSEVVFQDPKLMALVDKIKLAEVRVDNHRSLYDSVAVVLNSFLDKNRNLLKEVDNTSNLEKKPLFKAASPQD